MTRNWGNREISHGLIWLLSEEVIAEKIRALAQRARPRDVYDVVHFFRNRDLIKNVPLLYNVLQEKCNFKNIPTPSFKTIAEHEKLDELEPQWENMLAHQLPSLPPFQPFWDDIEPFFNWLEGNLTEEKMAFVSQRDETIFQPGRITNAGPIEVMLQRIQFAAANRVCIRLSYSGKIRTVEPLSFRTSRNGNKLFYGYERESATPKAYSLNKIQHVEITSFPYIEKYPIEISASGGIVMPPIRRASPAANVSRRPSTSGPKHVYRCNTCQKLFYRKRRVSGLNQHKTKDGYRCSGRSATYEGYR